MSASPPLAVLGQRLAGRQAHGLGRRLVGIGPATGPRVEVQGRSCLLMASNDYLGLSGHPRLIQAAMEASRRWGIGSGASRLAAGTLDGHLELEQAIAEFKGTPAALFFSTGYMTNLGVISSLAGPGDYIVSDQLNHASLIDACRLSRAQVRIYNHGDWQAAESLLEQAPDSGLRLLVSDGVFSMDGDMAPLAELARVARHHQALLVVDEAHATGVWGQSGRGSLEHYGLEYWPELVSIGTFSKALGGAGGFVAAAPEVINTLVQGARSFLYSTAPPPAQVAVAREVLALLEEEPWRRDTLHQLCARLRGNLEQAGLRLLSSAGPIVPVLVGEADQALNLAQALWQEGVYAPAMRPPTVPPGTSRLRLTVNAAHSPEDMDLAAQALRRAAKQVGLL